jgi:biopolymer transport protein ExbD
MELTVRLSVDEMSIVLNALAHRPYGEVHEVMAKLKSQVAQQVQPATKRAKA